MEDPHAKEILASINHEYELLRTKPAKGARVILRRLGEQPWHYVTWYFLGKPSLLWSWDIQVGQGDIYVYPTLQSPFVTQPGWRALETICQTLNPLLAVLALIGVIAASMEALRKDRISESASAQIARLAVSLLLVFATLVYTVLQSEPRYSIPFRALEILMAFSALQGVFVWVRGLRSVDINDAESVRRAPEHG